ncbi:MAG: sulfotransferase [archaeon]
MKDPIIVTGIPRSGTSMIAGILQLCGAWTGDVNNMFENKEIKFSVLVPYMNSINADFRGQKEFPNTENISIPRNFRSKIEAIALKQGCKQDDKWIIKSNLVSLTWPVWNYAFPNAKYVIVRRRPADIANSCMKTSYMDAYDNREDWIKMCRFYQSRFAEMVEEGLNCKVIWPHRMAYGDYGQIWELLEWTGLPWNSKVLNWVDPKFLKIRKKG